MENTIYGVFEEIVKNNKNEIAIIENDRTLTFEELSKDLPQFMIPEFIVKIPYIPLNENGKPDMINMPVVLKEGNDYGNNN